MTVLSFNSDKEYLLFFLLKTCNRGTNTISLEKPQPFQKLWHARHPNQIYQAASILLAPVFTGAARGGLRGPVPPF